MQRFFDIFFSGIAIICLSPLFVLIMVTLKLTGEGEIFFFQTRIGKNNLPIRLFKFATMLKNSEHMGTGTVTLRRDSRILPIGGFLRKTKINELPQLFNIFLGDMSVIGPRPQTQRCFDAFPKQSQARVIEVRPGLSGIGSIIFRDEEDMMSDDSNADTFYDQIIMPYKGSLEEWYVENNSIFVYFSLIILTIWIILIPKSTAVWKMFSSLPAAPPELTPFFFD